MGCHTLDVGYLFTAVLVKCSHCPLPWTWSISSWLSLLTLAEGHLLLDARHSRAMQPSLTAPSPTPRSCHSLLNLYPYQETTVRTEQGTTDWFQIGKGEQSRLYIDTLLIRIICRVHHEKHWLDEAQTGIKIAGIKINNFRYADDTTLMAENEEN